MAVWADLTPQEQALVQASEREMRNRLRQISGMNLYLWLQHFDDNVAPLLATLDAGVEIEKSDGLAGSLPLTHETVTAIRNWLDTINTGLETNQSNVVKAIGVENYG